MKCKHCDKTVRVSKAKHNERQGMCAQCWKQWNQIGKSMGKYLSKHM